MREKQSAFIYYLITIRITPAYAGKTGACMLGEGVSKDHPRVCGKNSLYCVQLVVSQGSPPRMREKLLHSPKLKRCPRITPAYAGKTLLWELPTKNTRDHPRVCGKNSKKIQFTGQYYFKKWTNLFTFVASNAVSLASSSALCGSFSMIPYSPSTFSSL